MTMDYPTDLNPKQRAKVTLASLGLNPSIMDMVPSSIISRQQMDIMSPGQFGIYHPQRKQIYLTQDAANSPQAYLHEYFHALQDSLNPQDKQTLEGLMSANPPEGQQDTGFTNYPGGAPTVHHPVAQGQGQWGLSSYIDYTSGYWKPDAEQFRSSTDQSWHNFPEPVLSFLREKFPALPAKQVNNWDLQPKEPLQNKMQPE